uniref:Putative secreted protein n=1 Tax=Anopheles darlingi TaxID=43151 RepID=A0A2M4DIZ6_ANODA
MVHSGAPGTSLVCAWIWMAVRSSTTATERHSVKHSRILNAVPALPCFRPSRWRSATVLRPTLVVHLSVIRSNATNRCKSHRKLNSTKRTACSSIS